MLIKEFDHLPCDEQDELMDEWKLSSPNQVLTFRELKHRIHFVDQDLCLTPALFLTIKSLTIWIFNHLCELRHQYTTPSH